MAREFAIIRSRIWHDPDFLALSSGAQRVYLLALSQDTLNLCGVTLWTPKRWAQLAANTSPRAVEKDVEELVDARFVVIDDLTEELWARTFIKWDGVLDVPNIIKSMSKDFDAVRSGRIRAGIVEWFKSSFPGGFCSWLGQRYPKAFPEGRPKGLGERFLEGLSEPLPEGFLTRVHAQPSPVSRLPSSETVSRVAVNGATKTHATSGPAGDLMLRTETDHKQTLTLAHRLADICAGVDRTRVHNEAAQVILWAAGTVDNRIIDEALGWAAASKTQPDLPRAVAAVIEAKAADHGIHIAPFRPTVGATP